MLEAMMERLAGLIRGRRGSLEGQTAIVTGASSGIGAATAQELAARGATVVLAARSIVALKEQARHMVMTGGRAMAIATDVTDPGQIAQLAHRTIQHFGRIDILVNCAGIAMPGPIARLTMDQINATMATNLIGPILLTRAVLPGMIARGHGVIISVASIAGFLPVDPLYSATKFGLRGFSFALARQLRGSGVSASIVSPGFIRTGMNQDIQGSLPGPDYVASRIAALVSEPRRETIVPPSYHFHVWAERLLPGVMEWLLRRWNLEERGAGNSVTNLQRLRRLSAPARPPRVAKAAVVAPSIAPEAKRASLLVDPVDRA